MWYAVHHVEVLGAVLLSCVMRAVIHSRPDLAVAPVVRHAVVHSKQKLASFAHIVVQSQRSHSAFCTAGQGNADR